jgi:lantibiotic biosynthesis protein
MKGIAEKQLNRITNRIMECNPANDSLFGGELAKSLFFYYRYEASGEEQFADLAVEKLQFVLEAFNNNEGRLMGPYYCNGISGLLYILILYIKKELIDDSLKEDISLLANQLLETALLGMEEDFNDFAHGSFGVLFCLIQYAELCNDTDGLNIFLRKIEGKYLKTEKPWIPSYIGNQDEKLKINFSFAHGQTGFLVLLMQAYRLAGITPEIKTLLKRNVDFVLGFKKESPIDNTFNYFPSTWHTETGEFKTSGRLAWCYGDFGPLFMLYEAAAFFGEPAYREIADELGIKTTSRLGIDDTMLESSQICHGTGGVAIMYKKLAGMSNLQEYLDASGFWMNKTIGYIEQELQLEIQETKVTDVVEGITGTGLVLMSYISDRQLDWGRMILI